MYYKKIFTILLYWLVNTNYIRFTESFGCCPFSSYFGACKPNIKHTRRKFDYSEFFNSHKNALVSPAECDLAVLNLDSIDGNKFESKRVGRCVFLHPKDVNILINKIRYKNEDLSLYTNPLYREVYIYRGKLYTYVYVFSYFGDEHYYYQIFRRYRYWWTNYSVYLQDDIDKLYFGNELSTREKIKEIFSKHVIKINVLGNTIPASFSRLGHKGEFILTSMVPSEYSNDVKFLSDSTRIIFNINDIEVEVPQGYVYAAVFKSNDKLRIVLSTTVFIKRLTYLLKGESIIDISHHKLTACLESHKFELIENKQPLREIDVDFISGPDPAYISHYYNDEVSYFPLHGKVINRVILPGLELDLTNLFESNYVKIKKFKYVTVVFISGLTFKGLPLSKYYVINHLQNITHTFYKPYAIDSLFVPKPILYGKFSYKINVGVDISDLGSKVTGNVKTLLCDLSENSSMLVNVGKVENVKIGNLELEFTDFLVDLSYHRSDQNILSTITLDKYGNKKYQFFIRMKSGGFRLTPPNTNANYINKFYHSVSSSRNFEFDTPLLVDVTNNQASPGVKVTFLPNSSVLYNVNVKLLADGKRPYISSVKIGNYIYNIKPGFAQVGVKVIDKFETMVIIDEKDSESNVFIRSIFSLSNKTNGILLKTTEIDWDSIVFLKQAASCSDYSGSNEYLLKFIVTNFRGTPGVIDKISINGGMILYVPAFGSNVALGDIVYKKVTNYWSKDYIFSLVMTEGMKETKLTVFRFLKNEVKLFIYYINEQGEQTYSYVKSVGSRNDHHSKCLLDLPDDGEGHHHHSYGDDMVEVWVEDELDYLMVNLDLRDVDERYFQIESNNNVNLISVKPVNGEEFEEGYKLKIGDVILPDGQVALNYYSYSDKTVEVTENKVTIYMSANYQPINIVYEKRNNRWYTKNKEDSRTLLAMENITPHHGMQYLTLDIGDGSSKTFVKVSSDFYYCGELIRVKGNYAYALLIHEGQQTTKMYLYQSSSKNQAQAEKYQCTSVPFNKPKFNTKWDDLSHVLDREMANEMLKSNIFFSEIPVLNLDSPLIPGVVKAVHGAITVYSCAGKRVGTLTFANVSLYVNSVFIRVFVMRSNGVREILVEYYEDYEFDINLIGFKEVNTNTFEKIDINMLSGTLGNFVKPYLKN